MGRRWREGGSGEGGGSGGGGGISGDPGTSGGNCGGEEKVARAAADKEVAAERARAVAARARAAAARAAAATKGSAAATLAVAPREWRWRRARRGGPHVRPSWQPKPQQTPDMSSSASQRRIRLASHSVAAWERVTDAPSKLPVMGALKLYGSMEAEHMAS